MLAQHRAQSLDLRAQLGHLGAEGRALRPLPRLPVTLDEQARLAVTERFGLPEGEVSDLA